ncbi:type II secretory pathway protein [Idiomarina sp. WRN-38]|jgi:type IV pilus assembly protein PilQ|uniref:type IV pilus secretin PilQ n=1 Tax=Idiomarina sp. OXR-189 TaxID=3100175 RepID=UPI0007337104|nr:type IV pilus secretin PilQ [Idiomarina sp. OXR-189]KTG24619.1 type II secretory pathway protein [Idiomarina sp. H105]OAE93125.1 type II secretory pathway protein [Idiomarina sp. WRN-38]WPZ01226.1 type IV pilus secretin PilQ [Idiomarina sp. OXR-189]
MKHFITTCLLASLFLFHTSSVSASRLDWTFLLSEQQLNEPVSLSTDGLPLRQLLQLLADQHELNILIGNDISGESTLKLNGVTWRNAFESVVSTHGLHLKRQGDLLWVTTEPQEQEDNDERTSTLLRINFAKAADLAALLKNDQQSFLSEGGAVSVDERTNTLIIRDTPEQVESVRRVIEKLDIPVQQVLIEARMVTVKANVSKALGVRWGASNYGLSVPEEGAGFIKGMHVDLPVTNPAGTFSANLARLSDDILLDLELTALEQENKAEIITSPKIFTSNQQAAYIEQGTEIPYVETAAHGATAVQFKKAVMGLSVTPLITPNNHVLMDLTITQNTRGDTVATPTGPAVAIDTQEMSTRVLARNGETIVLGGIFQEHSLNDDSRVPILGSVPVLGSLFSHEQQRKEKRELMIFVTPTILQQN